MRDADSSVQEYSEANVTTALNEAEKITEKAAKNARKLLHMRLHAYLKTIFHFLNISMRKSMR